VDEDDDALTALARELVTEKGIGERAAALWKSPQRQTSINGTPVVAAEANGDAARQAKLPQLPMPSELEVARPRGLRIPSSADQLTFAF